MKKEFRWSGVSSRRRFALGSASVGAGLASIGLVGCGDDDDDDSPSTTAPTSTGGEPVRGGVARISATGGNLESFDPAQWPGGPGHEFSYAVHDSVISYDSALVSQASRSLASEWEAVDQDRLVVTLRPDVRFHDGTPLNAEALRTSWQWGTLQIDAELNSTVAGTLEPIQDVEVQDELTAVYVTKRPFSPLVTLLGDQPGFIQSPASIETYGQAIGTTNPVGAGAFAYSSHETDVTMAKLVRNEDYWNPDHPYLDEIEFVIIPDEDNRANALRTGQLDVMHFVAPRIFASFDNDDAFAQQALAATQSFHIFLNEVRPPFNDARVRRALSLALDRAALTEVGLEGFGEVATGFTPPGLPEFNPGFAGVVRDVEGARALLSDAGFGSEPLRFGLALDNVPSAVSLGAVVQSQAAEAGIEIELEPAPAPDYYTPFFTLADNANALLAPYTGRPTAFQHYSAFFGRGGFNESFIPEDAEVERLLQDAAGAFDAGERAAIIHELEEYVAVEQAYAVTFYYPQNLLVRSKSTFAQYFGDGKIHVGQGDAYRTS